MTSVDISDPELVLLDGRCSPTLQIHVDRAKRRLAMASKYPDLAPHLAGLISSILDEAFESKKLLYQHLRVSYCHLCKESGGYVPYKGGYNKGRPNHNKPRYLPAIEFAWRFVTIQHHLTVGACSKCVEQILEPLKQELRDVQAQVPDPIRHPDAPKLIRWDLVTCKRCGWEGHEGEAKEIPALIQGRFRGKCPKCDAETTLGDSVFTKREGYAVVPEQVETVAVYQSYPTPIQT